MNDSLSKNHRRFDYPSADLLIQEAAELGINLPWSEDIGALFESFELHHRRIPNRWVVQPMEGFDGDHQGRPQSLTFRRYARYGSGGSGMIWFEATSINEEGRSNPHQLWIHEKSLDGLKKLVETTRKAAEKNHGHEVFLILQLTDSGRYSRPRGRPEPRIVQENPYLLSDGPVKLLTDDALKRIRDTFISAFKLAQDAGFDGVDVKACHGYLIHELLASRARKESRYGGAFENRIRLLVEIIERGLGRISGLTAGVRLSVSDRVPFPFGFGVSEKAEDGADLCEPVQLIEFLLKKGVRLFNITAGNPYHTPSMVRPFNGAVPGGKKSDEPPLLGVQRLIRLVSDLQMKFPETPMVGSGYSWLRQYLPYIGAGILKRRNACFIGMGRMAFAYPDAPADCREKGRMEPEKVCIACSHCTALMRAGRPAGCVVRDPSFYSPIEEKENGKKR